MPFFLNLPKVYEISIPDTKIFKVCEYLQTRKRVILLRLALWAPVTKTAELTNSADHLEAAPYEPPHQDLHSLLSSL